MVRRTAATMSCAGLRLEHVAGGAGLERLEQDCSLSYMDSIKSFSSGLRRCSSSAARIPVVFGIDTSRIARWTSSASAFLAASAPSLDSDTTSIRFGVEHLPQARADNGMIVGDQDAGDERDRHQTSAAGTSSRTSTPPSRLGMTASGRRRAAALSTHNDSGGRRRSYSLGVEGLAAGALLRTKPFAASAQVFGEAEATPVLTLIGEWAIWLALAAWEVVAVGAAGGVVGSCSQRFAQPKIRLRWLGRIGWWGRRPCPSVTRPSTPRSFGRRCAASCAATSTSPENMG